MSILDRSAANRHLDDDVLAEIWSTAAAEGGTATHPHLSTCARCRVRYSAFSGWLDELRNDAHAEADKVFTPERLAAQHAAVFRRLEALERPARVIAFPRHSRPVAAAPPLTRRWIAAAAAAGLVIGLAAGQILDLRQALQGPGQAVRSTPRSVDSTQATVSLPPGVQQATFSLDETLFYGEELDRTARGALYLTALDELIPRARDESDPNR